MIKTKTGYNEIFGSGLIEPFLELGELDKNLVSYAIGLYEKGKYKLSKDRFLELKEKYPDNLIILSYLVMIFEKLNEISEKDKIIKQIKNKGENPLEIK